MECLGFNRYDELVEFLPERLQTGAGQQSDELFPFQLYSEREDKRRRTDKRNEFHAFLITVYFRSVCVSRAQCFTSVTQMLGIGKEVLE